MQGFVLSFLKKAITRIADKKLSTLDDLYQKHSGEECYIFGDGISLKWMDLKNFSDRPSIMGNMSIFHNESKYLNKPYCSIIEPFFFYPYFPYTLNNKTKFIRHYFYKEYKKSIKQNPDTLFFINLSNYPVTHYKNVQYVSRWFHGSKKDKNLFLMREDSHQGTLKFQLSLAIFLGFKKAYLVGHDYTHVPSKSLHYYEKGEGIRNNVVNFSSDFIEYAKQHIDLVTVTLNSKSNMMNYINYKDLTGSDISFRENTDILDMAKLKSLDTWDDYTIF